MTYLASYEKVLQELRTEFGLGDDDQGFEWQGHSFYIAPTSAASVRHATLYVLVAPLDDKVSAQALKQLLWLQLQAVGPSTPVFGSDPESGQLVIAHTVPLADMTFAQVVTLIALLAGLAAQARGVLDSAPVEVPTSGRAAGVVPPPGGRVLPRGWLPQSAGA